MIIQMSNHPPNRISLHLSSYRISDPPSDYETIRLADLIHWRNLPTNQHVHWPPNRRTTTQPIDRSIDHPSEQPTHWPTNQTDRLNENRLTDWIIYRPTDRMTDRPTDSPATYHLRNWWTDRQNSRSSDCLTEQPMDRATNKPPTGPEDEPNNNTNSLLVQSEISAQ
jgi:hypothetical protein